MNEQATELEEEHYEDTSSFGGWMQWTTPCSEYRAEYRSGGIFGMYEAKGDSFVYVRQVRIKGEATPRKLTDAFMEAEEVEMYGVDEA